MILSFLDNIILFSVNIMLSNESNLKLLISGDTTNNPPTVFSTNHFVYFN
jgi:hypothetical protein